MANMNRWYQKENSRRFFRVDMPLHILVLPKNAVQYAEIYAMNINYFPELVEKELVFFKEQIRLWVLKIQDVKIIEDLFEEVILKTEIFNELLKMIAKGENPLERKDLADSLSRGLKGFKNLSLIEKTAPKTYKYFSLIEDKYLSLFKSVLRVCKNSTPDIFDVDVSFKTNYEIDTIMEKLDKPKFDEIPLVQAIKNLNKFLNKYIFIYKDMLNDCYLPAHPELWPKITTDISLCGVSISMQKRFNLKEGVVVSLYFPLVKKTIQFDGNVAYIETLEDKGLDRMAINFDMAGGRSRELMQLFMEFYEIDEILKLKLY